MQSHGRNHLQQECWESLHRELNASLALVVDVSVKSVNYVA